MAEEQQQEQTTFDFVKALIATEMRLNAEQITPDANFIYDLGLDELDTVELVMAVEGKLGISIPDERVGDEKLLTVQKFVDLIDEIKRGTSGNAADS